MKQSSFFFVTKNHTTEEYTALTNAMNEIDDGILSNVLECVGRKNFRFVAAVNQPFRNVYSLMAFSDADNITQTATNQARMTTWEAGVESLSHARTMWQECRELTTGSGKRVRLPRNVVAWISYDFCRKTLPWKHGKPSPIP